MRLTGAKQTQQRVPVGVRPPVLRQQLVDGRIPAPQHLADGEQTQARRHLALDGAVLVAAVAGIILDGGVARVNKRMAGMYNAHIHLTIYRVRRART